MLVGGLDQGAEFLFFGIRQGTGAAPGKVAFPIVANEGDEVCGRIGLEVGEAAVDGDEAFFLGADQIAGAVAGEDGQDGVGGMAGERGEEIGVLLENHFEGAVGIVGVGFDVDKED